MIFSSDHHFNQKQVSLNWAKKIGGWWGWFISHSAWWDFSLHHRFCLLNVLVRSFRWPCPRACLRFSVYCSAPLFAWSECRGRTTADDDALETLLTFDHRCLGLRRSLESIVKGQRRTLTRGSCTGCYWCFCCCFWFCWWCYWCWCWFCWCIRGWKMKLVHPVTSSIFVHLETTQ